MSKAESKLWFSTLMLASLAVLGALAAGVWRAQAHHDVFPLKRMVIQSRFDHLSAEQIHAAGLKHVQTSFFEIVEAMRAVNTAGVAPLYTPLSAIQEVQLRLRDDLVTESNEREANQRSAPAVENGLFLVPRVIE